ncbi:hypothetical protein R3W88_013631 [Solanum pinnatisectum]|uniref:FBD domain-containing protein n=1 Tax=Solanum pinnatisectum TaxID=50273 RepID=A0AAV9KQ64_9SOLN|nr:hypothetical protein R3W88_013631 [Solanum pinnatisectum]
MHFTLARCLISPPPVFKGFDRLISLKLRCVIISSKSLGSLISHCPLLENLELTYLDNSNPVEISAPKLKSFVFRGNIRLIHLNNVPLLSNVSYKPKEFSVEAEHDLGKIFEFIPALKNLRWRHDFVHVMLPYTLNRLKRLNICCITLGEFFALCLIRSSPNLKEFGIEVYGYLDGDYDEPVPQDAVDDIPASFSDMTLNNLRTVKIYGVTGAAAEMQLIKHDAITDHIEISAPKLRSFIFTGGINFLHLKNVPLLSKVSYEPTEFHVKAEHDVGKIFESIPSLENLCWINDCVQDVRVGPAEVIPTKLPYALHCLKRLYISGITLGEFFDVSFALCLIRSSPNLEEIEIEMYVVSHEDYFVHVTREAVDEIHASFSDMTFNRLRTIKLSNVAGAGAEMQLIKVLLAKSPALVKMVIDPYRMKAEKSLKVLTEITNFQRASSKAQVGYNVD